jgi:hypothetical protein
MRAGTGTRVRSTKGGDALPNGIGPSSAPWRKEPQGHIPAKGHFSFPPPRGVTKSGAKLFDHTLYILQLYLWFGTSTLNIYTV